MKTQINLILAGAISILLAGQTYSQILLEETYITPPVFPSKEIVVQGNDATSIHEYLIKNINYPVQYGKGIPVGTEVVQFEITAKGNLTSCKVINSISPEIDAEFIRILETTGGYWNPGIINGVPASMTREVSLVFKSYPGYDLVGNARKFQRKGNELLFKKNNPERALKYYNRAYKLLPYEECILAARSLCRYELGDEKGYLEDLDRLTAIHPQLNIDTGSWTPSDWMAHLKLAAMQFTESR